MRSRRFVLGFSLLAVLGMLTANPTNGFEDKPANTEQDLLKVFQSEFVEITPGSGKFPKSFQMGSKTGAAQEQPQHEVTFQYSFAIARYEVPQNLYQHLMGKNPSRWKGPRNSTEMMSWNEANQFCRRLTEKLRTAKLLGDDEEIRLPTEAEWEYCCRAGTATAYSFGDEATSADDKGVKASVLNAYGWHTGNAAGNDPAVGVLKPNPWGLYDIHGYLWEFVADEWHDDYTGAPQDGSRWGSAEASKAGRVLRGGSWKDPYADLRCATRRKIDETAKGDEIGIRCVKAKVKK